MEGMMYKVLIVDDEVLVRVGIKSTIDWESLGFTIVAEASNGEQAYEAYRLHKPQVILTDIRMPKKDGLWLTKKIRQEDAKAKILILTCYNDFAYAREALKNGADDYILKSEAEDEELIKAMSGVKKRLDSAMSEQERYYYLKDQIDTNIVTLKEKLLDGFLRFEDFSDEKLLSRCSELGFVLEESQFALMMLFRDDAERKTDFSDQEWQHMNNAILNIASGIVEECKISFLAKENNNEFIFLLSKKDMDEGMLQEVVESIRGSISQYFDVPLSVALSAPFGDIREVSGGYQELCLKADQLFYTDESSIISVSEITLQNINIFKIKKGYGQLLINYMDEEDEEKAIDIVSRTEIIFRENTANVMEVKLFYSNLISNIFERYCHCFTEGDETRDYTYYHSRIMTAAKMKSIVSLMKEIIFAVVRNIKKYRLDNSNYIIKKALDYIEKNYHKEVSLKHLSEYLNLSKHYVCYLFKKETGDNISLYVNKFRIEKAKHLVLESDCKIKEIYDRLGFSDQQYFSKTFKRITGMTVMQYRDSVLKKDKKTG